MLTVNPPRERKKRCFQSSRSAVLHPKPIVQTLPAHGCYRSCLVSRGNKKEIEKVGPRTFLLLRLSSFYNDYTIRFLVRSQIFVRERLVALGPDLAAAHFLCFKYFTYTWIHAIFFFKSDGWKSVTPAHDLKLLSVNILALSAFGPLAHHLESLS